MLKTITSLLLRKRDSAGHPRRSQNSAESRQRSSIDRSNVVYGATRLSTLFSFAPLKLGTAALGAIVYLIGLAAAPLPAAAQTACPTASEARSPIYAWIAAPNRHPLAGTILRGREPLTSAAAVCRPSPLEQLRNALAAHLTTGGIVLLGEVHDNGAHHALRGYLLAAIATDLQRQGQRAPALVMEHIRTDQQPSLGQTPSLNPGDPRAEALALLTRLDWANSGWPNGDLFLPIFEAVITHRIPVLPGHPTRAEVRDVARKGIAALPADTVSQLGMDVPLSAPLADALLDELEASHCGLMPRTAFSNMALAQRYRDAHMAAALIAAAANHGSSVLLAGNGHVRTDRGVPWDLRRMMPARKALTVLLLEVTDNKTDTAAYAETDPSGAPIADFVVLTPRVDRADPCEAMRARFKKR